MTVLQFRYCKWGLSHTVQFRVNILERTELCHSAKMGHRKELADKLTVIVNDIEESSPSTDDDSIRN